MRELERWARELPDDVLAVMLFGSLARGDHTGFSDADLLVVLSRSDKPSSTASRPSCPGAWGCRWTSFRSLQFPGQAAGNKMTRVCVTKGRNGDHSR
ncbi:MAG: nucleotidyltransferase domain-containing protein [Firmicutes bacterium]|nr:nucleotidyltransferase domain-containing protein [Bacillota bacterium]